MENEKASDPSEGYIVGMRKPGGVLDTRIVSGDDALDQARAIIQSTVEAGGTATLFRVKRVPIKVHRLSAVEVFVEPHE